MATNLQEVLSSGTPTVTGAKPITMESLPEATIDVTGGASELQIEGLGVKKTKDSLSAGTTSSTAALSTEDFFADLIADTNFKDPQSVFSFRNNAIQRIVETDPAILSSLTQPDTATPPPSSSSFSPSPATSSVSGFDTLFGQGGGDGLDSDSFGSFDSVGFSGDSSGVSSSGFDTATSDYTSAEKAGMAGAVSSALGVGIGLASGRDYSDVDLAASAAGLAGGTIGQAYGAYSTYSDLAASFGRGDFGISQGLAGVSGAIGAIGAISDVAGAISSGKDFSSIAEEAFDSALGFAQGAWSAITDPAAAVEAFTEYSMYGGLNTTQMSFETPQGTVNFNFNEKGQIATPGFISVMMGLTPISRAFSLAQGLMDFTGYTASISDRAVGISNALSMPSSFSATGNLGATFSAYSDFSNPSSAYGVANLSNVPGAFEDTFSFDIAAMAQANPDVAYSSLGLTAYNEAAVTQAYPNSIEEEEALTEAFQDLAQSTALDLGLDVNATTSEIADAISEQNAAAHASFTSTFDTVAEVMGFTDLVGMHDAAVPGFEGIAQTDLSTDPVGLKGAFATNLSQLQNTYGFEEALGFASYAQNVAEITGIEDLQALGMDLAAAAAISKESIEAYAASYKDNKQKAISDGRKASYNSVSLSLGAQYNSAAGVSFDTTGRGYNGLDLALAVQSITKDITFQPNFNDRDAALGAALANAAQASFANLGKEATSIQDMATAMQGRSDEEITATLNSLADMHNSFSSDYASKGGAEPGMGGVSAADLEGATLAAQAAAAVEAAQEAAYGANYADVMDSLEDGVDEDTGEGQGGKGDSGEVGGYNSGATGGTAGGTAGGTTSGYSDWGDFGDWGDTGDAGDAGGDAGTYICTAAYANGVTDYKTFSANRKYGINLRRNDPYLMKGYDLVGPRLAKMFGRTKIARVLTNYYKMDLDKKVLSFRYKLLQIFLKGIMRPVVRTIGYLDERIFK